MSWSREPPRGRFGLPKFHVSGQAKQNACCSHWRTFSISSWLLLLPSMLSVSPCKTQMQRLVIGAGKRFLTKLTCDFKSKKTCCPFAFWAASDAVSPICSTRLKTALHYPRACKSLTLNFVTFYLFMGRTSWKDLLDWNLRDVRCCISPEASFSAKSEPEIGNGLRNSVAGTCTARSTLSWLD